MNFGYKLRIAEHCNAFANLNKFRVILRYNLLYYYNVL